MGGGFKNVEGLIALYIYFSVVYFSVDFFLLIFYFFKILYKTNYCSANKTQIFVILSKTNYLYMKF